MKPNFLIIGAQKSGTTSLAETLRSHPDVFVCEPMEPEFFSTSSGIDVGEDANSWTRYQQLFSSTGEGSLRGEASTGTMFVPDVIPTLDRFVPEAKLIAILRDPVSRAYSGMAHDIKKGRVRVEEGSELFKEEALRFIQGQSPRFDWFTRSEYGRQLQPFIEHYRSRLRILIFEEVLKNQKESLNELQEFLGLSPISMQLTRENQSRVPKGKITQGVVALGRKIVVPVRSMLSERGYRRFRETMMRGLGRRTEALDLEFARHLQKNGFEQDMCLLENLLGRSVEVWRK